MAKSLPSSPRKGEDRGPSPRTRASDEWDRAFAEGAARANPPGLPGEAFSARWADAPRSLRASPNTTRFGLEAPLLVNEARGAAILPVGGGAGGAAPTPAEPPPPQSMAQTVLRALMYGLINTVVCAPVMIGFAAIIFRHQDFHRDPAVYAQLVKLVLFSAAVHQTAFTTTSSLPFAIGQVQDAGLIFLSKIAADVAEAMKDEPVEHMVATALTTLAISTGLLGLALMVTGYFKLAGLVQYLPLPVVGGER